MKLKLAFGFLPYLQFTKELQGTVVGSSKFFVVWLAPDAQEHTEKHEEMHIAWWYGVTAIATAALLIYGMPLPIALLGACVDPLLGTFVKAYKRFEESFAYAYAASHHPRPMQYIEELARSPVHIERYGDDFADKVRERVKKWFL